MYGIMGKIFFCLFPYKNVHMLSRRSGFYVSYWNFRAVKRLSLTVSLLGAKSQDCRQEGKGAQEARWDQEACFARTANFQL